MGRSWRIGRAFGIPLYVHPSFLLLPLLAAVHARGAGPLAVGFAVALVLALFGCVLLHELGHALAARRFGIGTRDITLYPIGGVARLERLGERPAEELVIALAGPAVNVAIVLLLTPAALALASALGRPADILEVDLTAGRLPLAAQLVILLWAANAFLALFNLVPAFPMDGGRVLRALLALSRGYLRATELAVRVGLVMAGAMAALSLYSMLHPEAAFNPFPLVLSLFVAFAGQHELAALRQRERVRQATAAAAFPQPPADDLASLRPYRPGFSGVTWHPGLGAWVRWRDGRAVAVYAVRTE